MARLRLPLFVAIPLVVAGGLWKASTALFGSSNLVVFTETPLDVEVIQGSGAPKKVSLQAGEHRRIQVSRGSYEVRFPSRPDAPTVSVVVGANETWVVPSSKDQCFAVVDFANIYRGSAHAAPVVQAKLASHVPERIETGTKITKGELQGLKAKDESSSVVDAVACTTLGMDDDAIIAAVAKGTPAAVAAKETRDKPSRDEMAGAVDKLVVASFVTAISKEGWTKTAEVDGLLVFRSKDSFALYRRERLKRDFPEFPSSQNIGRRMPALVETFKTAATATNIDDPNARGDIITPAFLTLSFQRHDASLTTPLGPKTKPLVAEIGFAESTTRWTPLTEELAKALDLDTVSARRRAIENGLRPRSKEGFANCRKLGAGSSVNCFDANLDDAIVAVATLDRLVKTKTTLDVEVSDKGLTLWKPKARKAGLDASTPYFFARVTLNGDELVWEEAN